MSQPRAPRRFDERWRLSRAGIVNVWHYLDNEFDLSGGRMILRGTNGSGKSRALEMLLPFLLDADRRRMDATGAARVNLDELMRTGAQGQSNRTGYLWLELCRPGGYLTVGALVRHSQSASSTKVWYFTSALRVGDGLELMSGSREPLSREALTELVGADCITDSPSVHRERIRTEVFGLGGDAGRDRYDGLLQLLHTLRAPDVGNRIDEGRLPQILLESLPPLHEEALGPGRRAARRPHRDPRRAGTAGELGAAGSRVPVRVPAVRRRDAAVHGPRHRGRGRRGDRGRTGRRASGRRTGRAGGRNMAASRRRPSSSPRNSPRSTTCCRRSSRGRSSRPPTTSSSAIGQKRRSPRRPTRRWPGPSGNARTTRAPWTTPNEPSASSGRQPARPRPPCPAPGHALVTPGCPRAGCPPRYARPNGSRLPRPCCCAPLATATWSRSSARRRHSPRSSRRRRRGAADGRGRRRGRGRATRPGPAAGVRSPQARRRAAAGPAHGGRSRTPAGRR